MSNAVEETLRDLESRLDRARAEGDAALFERVLSDDFRTTSPAGAVSDRAQMLADVRSRTLSVASSRSQDITIRVYGQTAIVRGTAVLKARYRGYDISGPYAYTHVYMLRGDAWQVVAAHSSRRMPDWVYLVLTKLTNLFHLTRT